MLKCASLYTREMDDTAAACGEILSQLGEKLTLQANTIGIVTCHSEFILSGALKAICDALPFDTVGMTTASLAASGVTDELILSVFVITSDDVSFKTGRTGGLRSDTLEKTRSAYESVKSDAAPALILAFAPLLQENPGDVYASVWGELLPQVPVFGSLAIDGSVDFTESRTLYNGEESDDGMAFALCYGNIHPRMFVTAQPEDGRVFAGGEVTKADGPFIREINGEPAYNFYEKTGLALDGLATRRVMLTPFVADLKTRADYDGVPVMRGFVGFTPEGGALMRGCVDEGSLFTIASYSADNVMDIASKRVELVNAQTEINGMLSFSCITSRITLGTEQRREMELYRDEINPEVPFCAAYSGGELCPTSVRDGKAINRFHNYTLITLIL
ncbi:hypothetical protein FACS18949_11390 [Clostridia bacterium]|nr:hypothetical protein FACS18949_11390 [Clostridia bacterium]